MNPERLREAAKLMRSRAERATSGPWEFRPRRGFQMMSDSPATIGFTDDAGYFTMLREGTWATQGDMEYVASWHPAVALAVADWLDQCAAIREEASDGPLAMAMRAVTEPADVVADAYLGGVA